MLGHLAASNNGQPDRGSTKEDGGILPSLPGTLKKFIFLLINISN